LVIPAAEPGQPPDYALISLKSSEDTDGFCNPVRVHLQKNPKKISAATRIVFEGNACVPGDPTTVKVADPTKTQFFPSHLYAIHLTNDESGEAALKDVVTKLNSFAMNHHGQGEGLYTYIPTHFVGKVTNQNRPWSDYLQHKSTCRFLKKYYADNTKNDIISNDNVMIRFFGSTEVGRAVMNKINDHAWATQYN
jgi:hypothetical protein